MLFWLSRETIYHFEFASRGHAVAFIEDFLGDLVAPDVTEGHADIKARAEVSEALLHSGGTAPILREQVERL